MLIHLTPRFYLQYCDVQVDLVDITIPEFEITLKNNVDLMIKTPYPNKCYKVACRKKGRKAINGIFIETDEWVGDFTVITRWSVTGVDGEGITTIVSHTTHFHVNDSDYDAVTECQMLWSDFYNTPYESRKNSIQETWIPARDQPRMFPFDNDERESERFNQYYNHINHNSLITERVEYYTVPTVERERLIVPFFGNDRFPSKEDVFQATVKGFRNTLKPTEFSDLGVSVSSFSEFVADIINCSGESIYEKPNTSLIHIFNELREDVEYFFSNSNDLVTKVRRYSDTYSCLRSEDREYVDSILSQPLFSISFENPQHQ